MNIEALAPHDAGDSEQEPFDDWARRIAGRGLDHVPRDLLESWLHRHWVEALEDLENWLPLDRLRFDERALTDAEVLALRCRCDDDLNDWSGEFLEQGHHGDGLRESWVGQEVARLGTYPVRPLVLEPQGIELPEEFDPGHSLYLIEGHMRTAFVRALCREGRAKGPHLVWVARLTAS